MLIKFNEYFFKDGYPRDAVIEFVSVIASVSGVILALFYPVIATIVSSAYAKVHSSIKSLVLREKATQSYLKQLTFLTASAITVLMFMSLGFNPRGLLLSFLLLYSLIMLFAILRIGMGAFTLLEPRALALVVQEDLFRSIKNATIDGEYWYDPSFQAHYYKNAYKETENLIQVSNLCSKDAEINEASILQTLKANYYILESYLARKYKIPIKSNWFPFIYHHPSFFETDMTSRELARNTSTFAQPKSIQNYYWLEDQIIRSINICVNSISEKRIDLAPSAISSSHNTLQYLANGLEVKTAEAIILEHYTIMKGLGVSKEENKDSEYYNSWKDELQCVASYVTGFFHLQAVLLDRLAQYDSKKISYEFEKWDWNKKESIYKVDVPPELYETLNSFSQFVENEFLVEGKQVTPSAYFKQQLTNEYLKVASEKLQKYLSFFENYLIGLTKHYDKEKHYLLASYLAHFSLELVHKFEYRLEFVKKSLEDLDTLEVWKKEFPWNKPNFQEITERLKSFRAQLIEIIAENIDQVSKVEWNNEFPDVFSQSYAVLSNTLNECFRNNDIETYSKLFPHYLRGSFNAFGLLNRRFEHYSSPTQISHQPIIDAMHTSSYAYIYSVIYKDDRYWQVTISAWDNTFIPKAGTIELLIGIYNYYHSYLLSSGLGYGEVHARGLTLREVCETLHIALNNVEDKLAKAYIPEDYHTSFYDLAELFIEHYLFTFPEAKSAAAMMQDRKLFKYIYKEK